MKSAALLLPFVLVPSFSSASPDVIIDDQRPMWCFTTVEAGSFALCRTYVIVKGDTFDEIAKRECGDRRCAEEIRLLNPDEKPSKLQPGTTIAIPPRVTAATSRPESRATATAGGNWIALQYRNGQYFPIIARKGLMSGSRHLGSSIVAVTRSKLAWLLRGQWKNLEATEGVAYSAPLYDGGFVDKDDPTMRIERAVTLKDVKDGRLVIDVVDTRFDQQGRVISRRAVPAGTDTLREGGMSVPILLISVVALLAIVRLIWKRRTTRASPALLAVAFLSLVCLPASALGATPDLLPSGRWPVEKNDSLPVAPIVTTARRGTAGLDRCDPPSPEARPSRFSQAGARWRSAG